MASDPKLADDLVPIGQFKSQAATWLRRISEQRRSIVITQNGRAAAVVMSPHDYDELRYQQRFVEDVARGLADADAGNTRTTAQLRRHLMKRRKTSR